MKNIIFLPAGRLLVFIGLCIASHSLSAQNYSVHIVWDHVLRVSQTTPTLQVVVNPMLRAHSPIHEGSFRALKSLGAEYVRYVPWFPYTRLAVAELYPPSKEKTFWEFTLIDSMTNDFMEATAGHQVVINFSTIPAWMFKTNKPVNFPDDANTVFWDYNQGLSLRDSSMKELTGYYSRLFSWYTRGGFTDELGTMHKSSHAYKIPYWEVLNEPDLEHNLSVQAYTKMYDAIVGELKKISPQTRFVGISLAFSNDPEWFEYFLNKKNHKPGIPLDAISYHFYASPTKGQTLDQYQYSFLDQATGFLNKVRYIESIRKRLSPHTITTINEIGSIINPGSDPIPAAYWNLSGAMYAHIFVELTKLGIEVAGESQLVGYPTQFPDVSMMNWENGKPNSRYWVLKLIKDHIGPGDRLVETEIGGGNQALSAQAFISRQGKKELLLINLRNEELKIILPSEFSNSRLTVVDGASGENEPAIQNPENGLIVLKPFAVAILQ